MNIHKILTQFFQFCVDLSFFVMYNKQLDLFYKITNYCQFCTEQNDFTKMILKYLFVVRYSQCKVVHVAEDVIDNMISVLIQSFKLDVTIL